MKLIKKHKKIILTIVLTFLFLYIGRLAFLTIKVVRPENDQAQKILDRNGQILFQQQIPEKGYKNYLEIKKINPDFLKTIVAIEDKRFYSHNGIDIPRLVTCTKKLIGNDSAICGASTITQQYIKVKLERSDRTIKNKVEEMILSLLLEKILTKDEILERYANSIYFSNLRYGIESASQGYFGKPNTELDKSQVTFLAAIPNSPQRLNPYEFFDQVRERQKIIIDVLLNESLIEETEANSIKSQDIFLQNNFEKIHAPHLIQSLDLENSQDIITTSLDLNLYNKSLETVNKHIAEIYQYNVTNAAVVILDAKTGEVLTMIGSRDFYADDIDGQVNSATALRNPGSTLKPFTYSLAFEQGLTPSTLINDTEHILTSSNGKDYYPKNYDMSEHGFVTIREALSNSYNIPAVMTLQHVGVSNFYNLADQIGLEEIRQQDGDIAATLGGTSVSLLDITNAYRIFTNEGKYLGSPKLIKLENYNSNNSEEFLFGNNSKEITYLISDILSDNEARRSSFGSLSQLNLPFKAHAKTGTAQDFRDSWTIGYTGEFIVGVWVGNNDNSEMDGINGVQGAGKIWNDIMQITYEYYQDNGSKLNDGKLLFEIPKPENIISIEICKETGDTYSNNICPSSPQEEVYIKGFTPNDPVLKVLDIQNQESISILDPYNNDVFYFEENLNFPIQFKSNNEFEKYILNINGQDISETENQNQIKWLMEPGQFEMKIIGIKNGIRTESIPIQIFVEK